MFPIHNCRAAPTQPGRGVRALSSLSVGLLSLLPYSNQSILSPLFLPLSIPSFPHCAHLIFHYNISIFMPHLRKFKVTVRRHNFLPPSCRQRRTLPNGQAVGSPSWAPFHPLVTGDREKVEGGPISMPNANLIFYFFIQMPQKVDFNLFNNVSNWRWTPLCCNRQICSFMRVQVHKLDVPDEGATV